MANQNTIALLGYYGSDEIHAASGWTSTVRNLSSEKIGRIPKFLAGLAADGHHTPFEKSMLHFIATTDIATHIQILKHRIGVSVNGESARYKELKEDKFYIPEEFYDVEPDLYGIQDIMPEAVDKKMNWGQILEYHSTLANSLYHACLADVEKKFGRKRAKESARFFKGYNSQIEIDLSFNFRSFAHFQGLRNSDHSQREVARLAKEALKLVCEIPGNPFQHTIAAFKFPTA